MEKREEKREEKRNHCMKTFRVFLLLIHAVSVSALNSAFAMAEDPQDIFRQVVATYEAMPTYQAEGKVDTEIDMGMGKMPTTTYFSIQLQKPNLYKIAWQQEIGPGIQQHGAVWNRGNQPFLYLSSMNVYSKVSTDLEAISTATGISGGAAFTIPSLFFSFLDEHQSPFGQVIEPHLVKIESIHGEDCYVISGRSSRAERETYWISQTRYLIRRYSRTFVSHGQDLSMTDTLDRESEAILNKMGKRLRKEDRQALEQIMRAENERLKSARVESTTTEFHETISLVPLAPEDFEFDVPAGAQLKSKLFPDGPF